jgi:hypothetical protein
MHFELTIEDMGPDKQIVIYAADVGSGKQIVIMLHHTTTQLFRTGVGSCPPTVE